MFSGQWLNGVGLRVCSVVPHTTVGLWLLRRAPGSGPARKATTRGYGKMPCSTRSVSFPPARLAEGPGNTESHHLRILGGSRFADVGPGSGLGGGVKTEVEVVNCFYHEALLSFDDRAITIQELGIDPLRPSRPVC